MDIQVRKGFKPHIIYICAVPFFFLLASIVYNPFGIKEAYSIGNISVLGHITLLSCIVLVATAISRLFFWLWRSRKEMNWWNCLAWALLEIAVVCCFMALYTSLMSRRDYIDCLPVCACYSFLILPYPYLVIAMVNLLRRNYENGLLQTSLDEGELMKFYDEHGKLKIVINSNAILFIKAEDNYIRLNYLEGGSVKSYELRNSMRSIEEMAAGHGIFRCQRSYYINPKHIRILRKDKDGFMYADLDLPDVPSIPISKRYYELISSLL